MRQSAERFNPIRMKEKVGKEKCSLCLCLIIIFERASFGIQSRVFFFLIISFTSMVAKHSGREPPL